jgi:hypothetical protein
MDMPGCRVVDAEHQAASCGFTATAFTDNTQRFAVPNVEIHAIDCAHDVRAVERMRAAAPKMAHEFLDAE